jgi:hypothetical protein
MLDLRQLCLSLVRKEVRLTTILILMYNQEADWRSAEAEELLAIATLSSVTASINGVVAEISNKHPF